MGNCKHCDDIATYARIFVVFDDATDEMLMCLGGMYIPGQPSVVTNGMMGVSPQMTPAMQVSNAVMECGDFRFTYLTLDLFKSWLICYLVKKTVNVKSTLVVIDCDDLYI